MNAENEFNARHFLLMQEAIQQFDNNSVAALGALVQRLDEINSVLKNPSKQWDKQFAEIWLPMELIYADLLEENRGTLSGEESEIIRELVKKLAILAEEKMGSSQ